MRRPSDSQGEAIMVLTGTVRNGVVVLNEGPVLPDGTVVHVEVNDNGRNESVGKRLMKFAGTAKGLPADMAEQHDHYIHGQPKK